MSPRPVPPALRIVLTLGLLYAFLVSIKLLETAFKTFGEGSTAGLLEGVAHPIAGLAVGILATVIVQSSSVTTSAIVGLVGSGELPLGDAVPMIMGANIGTTVTNTLVSIASLRRSMEFQRAFACATVHDVFNFMAVTVLLPFELATGFMRRTAESMATRLSSLGTLGTDYNSPIKAAVKAGAGFVKDGMAAVGLESTALGIVMLLTAIALIFASLRYITVNMRAVLISRIESQLNAALARAGSIGLLIGILITVSVQSSSITTSLLVPLCAAGILTIQNAYPITLGANIGTTVTALLASLAAETSAGLAIALVHLLFNMMGTLLLYPVPALRRIPPRVAERLAVIATHNKLVILAYVIVLFVFVPVAGVFFFK